MKNPINPFLELKETIKHIAKLDEIKNNTIFITTKEPTTIEQLIEDMNKKANSNMHLKQENYNQLTSAGLHYFTYRIVPSNNNIKKIEYEKQMKEFKLNILETARSFISKHYNQQANVTEVKP